MICYIPCCSLPLQGPKKKAAQRSERKTESGKGIIITHLIKLADCRCRLRGISLPSIVLLCWPSPSPAGFCIASREGLREREGTVRGREDESLDRWTPQSNRHHGCNIRGCACLCLYSQEEEGISRYDFRILLTKH